MSPKTAPLELEEIRQVFESWLQAINLDEDLLRLWNNLYDDLRMKSESKYKEGCKKMPIHVAPAIRFLEEAEEAEGLIKTLDSVGVTIQKAKESAGATKLLPSGAAKIRIIRGTVYTAS